MLELFAQAGDLTTYSPEWWIRQFKENGFGSLLSALILYLLYRYAPRVIEGFVAATDATTQATTANKDAIASLVEMKKVQDETLTRIASTQQAAVASANALVDLHASAAAREEMVISRACDLVELVTLRVAPGLLDEVRGHTNALRALAHGKR
jgi:hypothetical protein